MGKKVGRNQDVHRGNDAQAVTYDASRWLLVGLALAGCVALGKAAKPAAFPHFHRACC
jgi:hypothetical protein